MNVTNEIAIAKTTRISFGFIFLFWFEARTYYFGATLKRYKPIAAKIRLGIQTAIKGATEPFVANVVEICRNKMYAKLSMIPIPNCIPIPPLTLRLESATPMSVRINVETGTAIRRYF